MSWLVLEPPYLDPNTLPSSLFSLYRRRNYFFFILQTQILSSLRFNGIKRLIVYDTDISSRLSILNRLSILLAMCRISSIIIQFFFFPKQSQRIAWPKNLVNAIYSIRKSKRRKRLFWIKGSKKARALRHL